MARAYEDAGISGAKGRDQRPGLDAAMKDATRRRFDVLMVWSVDRLGRSLAGVAAGLDELHAAGVAIYADVQGMDATTPHGKAMLQMAAVFAELERAMIRDRVNAGLARAKAQGKTLGRPKVAEGIEGAIRARLAVGDGMLKVAKAMGVGVSTVQRVRREMNQAEAEGGAAAEVASAWAARPVAGKSRALIAPAEGNSAPYSSRSSSLAIRE